MTQQVNDGYYEVAWKQNRSALVEVFTHSITGKKSLVIDREYYDVDKLIEQGRTFTPLLAMSPERVDALATLLGVALIYAPPDHKQVIDVTIAMLNDVGAKPKEPTNDPA